jgi:hypothetical protein
VTGCRSYDLLAARGCSRAAILHLGPVMPLRSIMPMALMLLALSACAESAPSEPMPRETFIDVMVQLRRAAAQDSSQAAFDAARARILEQAGVTDSALLAYVRAYGRRLDFLAELWDTVDARLIVQPDTAS